MKSGMTCESFRERIVDNRDGGMDPILRHAWEDHRRTCAACNEEATRDERLCALLASVPAESPFAVTWSQVLAARQPITRTRFTRPAAWALASATIAALALLVPPLGNRTDVEPIANTPAQNKIVADDGSSYANAHTLVSAADMSGDPNRAVLITFARGATQ